MRDLLFKNLTSREKKRKILSSSEIVDKEGIRSVIRRHFVCLVKEVKEKPAGKPLPYLYVLKQRNTKAQKERFFCRIKGSMYAINNKKLYLLLFMHSLKITLTSIPKDSMQYSE